MCKRLNGKITLIPTDIDGTKKIDSLLRIHFVDLCNVTEQKWGQQDAWIGGMVNLGDKYGASHWWPAPDGIYGFEDPDTGRVLTNEVNKKFFQREVATYQKLVNLCASITMHISGKDPSYIVHKCKRKVIGRVLCEFDKHPVIIVKGLCAESRIDRSFQLINPSLGEGNDIVKTQP